MTTITLRLSIAAAAVVSLGACGGGGGDDAPPLPPPPPPPPPAAVQEGAFKDANVSGLSYESGQQSGVTNAVGRYTCETGNTVTFSVGAVELGSTECTTLASPPALVGNGQIDDPAAANMARFLLMLDTDQDNRNGLNISEGLQVVADSWPAIDFAAADFDAEVTVPISDIMSVEERMAFLPGEAFAIDHLRDTLSCAYSGAFVGTTAGDRVTNVTLNVGRGLFFRDADDLNWAAYDPENGTRTTVATYEVSAPPTFDTSTSDPNVQVTGTFDTPNSISGTWNLPLESLSGTYSVNRLGSDTAESRLNGQFTTTDGGSGVLVLDITGDAIAGEAFEVFEGVLYTITGSIDGDAVELTAVGGGETITGTGTVTRRDQFGLPRDIFGDLDVGGGVTGGFFGRGCKLN
ncbi:MAG: hypothetical protein AAFX44_19805 [Pseudomonadota bacterium]